MRLRPFAFVAVLALLGASPLAHAKPKPRAAPPAAAPGLPGKQLEAIVPKLLSSDVSQALAGLQEAQAVGAQGGPLAEPIEAILKRGAPLAVAKAAIEALGAIGASSSSAVLRPYVRHRVPEFRRAAARAMSSTKGPDAIAALRDGLRSPDNQVRGFSATGLGNLWAAEAMDDLFLALDHNVTEAASSIGLLCTAEQCDKFLAKLGSVPLDVMTSGIDPIFFRAKPFPEGFMTNLVGQIRELGSPEAGKYLADVLSRWPTAGSKRVHDALDSAVASLPRGPR